MDVELYATEVIMFNGNQNSSQMTKRRVEHWTRPPEDVLKINCDASFIHESKAGSWGVIIREWDGDAVIAGRGKVDRLLSPFHAELIACLQGLQMAVNIGASRVILEMDAQEVVRAINSNAYVDSDVGLLISEAKSLIDLNFSLFECKFVGRMCNKAADKLAELGYKCEEFEGVISPVVPNDVSVIVANDLLAVE